MAEAKKKAKVETTEGPVSEAPIEAPASKDTEVKAPEADEVREPVAVVNLGEVPAQVKGERAPDNDTVSVNETYVSVDEVITDPSDPKAVQVPEQDEAAGKLPIHALSGKTPEESLKDSDKS